MNGAPGLQLTIRRLDGAEEAHLCAQVLTESEPWVTLRWSYPNAVKGLNDPDREVYVGLHDATVVGFTILNLRGPLRGYVQTLAVMPEQRNRGIGSKLIKFAEQRIFGEFPNVFLCVSSFNLAAQRFYKRLGYEPVGELKDYVVQGHSEILMRKTIAPMADFVPETQAFERRES